MNNKLIARIAAAAISASLLSTVAFAADPTLTVADDTATLSFKVGESNADVTISSEDQITMMAYLVDGTVATPADIPAYADQAVVALDQVAGATGFGDVLIAASKLEAGKKIAVVLGGSDGTTEKYLIAQEVVDDKVVVTVMNGATAIEVEAVDGKVTLPADTAWNGGTPVAGAEFTLYSWVTADGAKEYLAGAEVDAAELKDVTLYAKFNTGIIVGDVDFMDGVDSTDSTYIDFMAFYGENYLPETLNQPIFAGSNILIGDVDLMDGVDSTDSTYIDFMAFYGENYLPETLGATIYLVNKAEVEAVYVPAAE